jgi:HlyD family type I secretion membrane fusion protein
MKPTPIDAAGDPAAWAVGQDHERRGRRLAAMTVWILVALVLVLMTWAALASLSEVARTRGQVKPVGDVQVLQSLNGGLIETVHVKPGDLIEAGQPIATFDPVHESAEVQRLAARRAGLRIKAELIMAFVEQREADFSTINPVFRSLVDEQRRELLSRNSGLVSALEVKQREIAQHRSDIAGIEAELPSLRRQLDVERGVLDMFAKLTSADSASQMEILNARKAEAEAANRLLERQNRKVNLEAVLATAEGEIDRIRQGYFGEAMQQRSEVLLQLEEVNAQLDEARKNLSRNRLCSPIAGIIKSLPHEANGSVVQPGGIVAEIVPVNTGYLIEVQVSPRDIGFVSVGQEAQIKVDTYDFSRYGWIPGRLERISASTFADERGNVFYKAWARPAQDWVGADKTHRLLPGMTAEVDIITGERTVLSYLLKPLITTAASGLRER